MAVKGRIKDTLKPGPVAGTPSGKPFVGKKQTKEEKVEEGKKKVEELKQKGELVNPETTEQRREQVYKMYMQGIPTEVIATTMQVTERQVRYDLVSMTNHLIDTLAGVGGMGIIARSFYGYEHLIQEARLLLAGFDDKQTKDKIETMFLLKHLIDSQAKMVMSIAGMPKGSKPAITQTQPDGQVEKNFTPQDANRALHAVLDLVKKNGVYEPAEPKPASG